VEGRVTTSEGGLKDGYNTEWCAENLEMRSKKRRMNDSNRIVDSKEIRIEWKVDKKTQLDKMFRLEIALILIYSQFMPVAENAINPPKLSQKTSNHHGHDHVMGTFLAS
jgi:hypothetical protein